MTDLRLALRLCFRHPLRPLPYADPANLVAVWETRADNPKRAVAPANFLDWRRETSTWHHAIR